MVIVTILPTGAKLVGPRHVNITLEGGAEVIVVVTRSRSQLCVMR